MKNEMESELFIFICLLSGKAKAGDKCDGAVPSWTASLGTKVKVSLKCLVSRASHPNTLGQPSSHCMQSIRQSSTCQSVHQIDHPFH